jgi:hypothetical protein
VIVLVSLANSLRRVERFSEILETVLSMRRAASSDIFLLAFLDVRGQAYQGLAAWVSPSVREGVRFMV